ncbi:MAG TPA: hypothetical protein VFN64_10730, partial [Burkholderiaceae bacterium]|nr:hypothetical protein [Burkholderiaceae bacterium]
MFADTGRRRFVQGGAAIAMDAGVGSAAGWARDATPSRGPKVLRVAFIAAESGFDPARYGDLYST